ncbi:MAG: mRNA surveillance protein Pelota [Desulfurococcales archaeon]|nr:mRNA surveillance protein Pelota [Desulfurococcales archaeon]
MKVEVLSKRSDRLRIKPESEEDLWTLKTVLRPGDYVRARTVRDVSIRGSQRKEKRPIIVKIRVKDVSFQPFTGRLRIFGVIVEGPERYGIKGKHQSIIVTPGTELEIEREGGWPPKVLEKLRSSGPKGRAVIAAVDYDEYAIAVLSVHGYKLVADEYLRLPGKDDPSREQKLETAIDRIAKRIVEAAKQYNANLVVIGGPGHLKDEVAGKVRVLNPHLKVSVDSLSMGGRAGIEELLRRPTLEMLLKEFSVAQAERVLEQAMIVAARNPELVAFGIDSCLRASEIGAVKELIIVDSTLYSINEEISGKAEELIENVERYGGKVYLVPEDSPIGEKLRPLGDAVAILRFPVRSS